ncbi:class I SAM-dependent methyltransferase [Candidatus Bipolaricaulota bacterium]|nr:class I SAM-dependent methyltransferase [Candidatus Bipolaricaulota bacterium]
MTHRPEDMSAWEQKQIVREGYDKLACDYRPDSTLDDYEQYAQWIQLLADELPHGGAVLDIGYGCGLPATKLLAEHFDVIGVDFSEVQIERAKKLVSSARFLCSDISELTFLPQSFDAIVSFYAIIHMPIEEHPKLFASIARWLKPGGIFLATIGHTAWTGTDDAYLDVPGGKMAWSHADEATNVRWLTQAGFYERLRFEPV